MTYTDTQSHNARVAELARLRQRAEELSKQVEAETGHLQDVERANRQRQVRADDAFRGCGLRAPEAMPGETETQYRRRLVGSLAQHSPSWKGVDVTRLGGQALDNAEEQVFADAKANGATAGLKPYEIRAIENNEVTGRKTVNYVGGPGAHYIRQFSGPMFLGTFRSREAYEQMSRDSNAARIEQIMRGNQRPVVRAPQAAF